MEPINVNKRIDILDYLRGFALLGIILVNVVPLLSVQPPNPNSIDSSYQRFLYLFVEGRFYPIFSFLFGVGFYLFITRANVKGNNGFVLFLRRILVLFIFGFLHFIFHPGEALTVYACCGLLLLPFYKARKEVNLVIGIIGLLLFGSFTAKTFMSLPLMLIGLAAAQYQVFEGISKNMKKVAVFTMIMFVFSAVGLFYQSQYLPALPINPVDDLKKDQVVLFIKIGIMIGPILSAFYMGVLILLLQLSWVEKLLSPLKSYGRMALTNYVSQTALLLLAGNVFKLFNQISYLHSLFLCIAIYIIQLIFSDIWLRFFRFGPLEWLWRRITYMKVP